MKKTFKLTTVAVLLALSGSLFAATVVTVNGVKIDSSDVERRAENVQKNTQGQISDGPQLRQFITNELITEQLVVQEAKRLKLDKSSDYQAAEAEALKQAKAQGLDKQADFKQNWADYQNRLLMLAYAANLAKQQPISEAAAQQQYNQIKSRYAGSSEIQLGEIVTNKPADAEAAINDLTKKKKFSDVAKKYSMSKSSQTSGGIVPEYVALPDLKDGNNLVYQAVNGLSKGQFTKTPVKDGNVSLVLYVNDKRAINVPTFNEMKASIVQQMEDEQLSLAIDNLGKKAKIVPAK